MSPEEFVELSRLARMEKLTLSSLMRRLVALEFFRAQTTDRFRERGAR
jgi:hypothetical protein